MKIPQDIRDKYLAHKDPEAEFFLDCFDEEPYESVLEVGANDNFLAEMLRHVGFNVLTVDLKDYPKPGTMHQTGDFCDLASNRYGKVLQTEDIIYSISALEHFGLGTYTKEQYQPYYDVVAARYIHDLLKPGGVAYISVPFGGRQVELNPHWRVYDQAGLNGRIIQDLEVVWTQFRVVELNGFTFQESPYLGYHVPCGTVPTQAMIQSLTNGEPYISALLKLRKNHDVPSQIHNH